VTHIEVTVVTFHWFALYGLIASVHGLDTYNSQNETYCTQNVHCNSIAEAAVTEQPFSQTYRQ